MRRRASSVAREAERSELERQKRGRDDWHPPRALSLRLAATRSRAWPRWEAVYRASRLALGIRGMATAGRGRVSRQRSNGIARRSRT